MSLATLADAITPHVQAVLIASEDGFTNFLNVKAKLSKLGIEIVREVRAERFTAESLSKASVAVMLEGAATQGRRDHILSLCAKDGGKPLFILNKKASHDSWRRLGDYAKRIAISVVTPEVYVRHAPDGNGPRVSMRDNEKVASLLDLQTGVEYRPQLGHPIRDMIGKAQENPEYNSWTERFKVLEAEWKTKEAEITAEVARMKADAETTEALYREENDKQRATLEELRAALERESAKNAELLTSLEAQETEIEGLQKELKDARILARKTEAGTEGARTKWTNVYKAKYEDAMKQIEELRKAHNTIVGERTKAVLTYDDRTREIESLKAKIRRLEEKKESGGAYDPAVSDRKVRAILDALEVGALTRDQAFASIVRIAGGAA